MGIMKTKVKRFNDLPYEERDVVNYYVIEGRFNEIDFILNRYKEDISPRLKSLLNKRKKDLENFLDSDYEV